MKVHEAYRCRKHHSDIKAFILLVPFSLTNLLEPSTTTRAIQWPSDVPQMAPCRISAVGKRARTTDDRDHCRDHEKTPEQTIEDRGREDWLWDIMPVAGTDGTVLALRPREDAEAFIHNINDDPE
jgi:hypothetical protein